MHFLYPIGLLALASILSPIIIHLWRINQGKTLKIGSISLLGESASSNAKSFQISDWLLLLLRCLLLIIASLLLASPYLTKQLTNKTTKGWILIDPNYLSLAGQQHAKTIDSLLKSGFELHEFALGFKKIDWKDTASVVRRADTDTTLNYSSLIKALDAKVANGFPVWIFADRKVINFNEQLPKIHMALHWQDLKTDLPSRYAQFLNKTYEVQSDAIATKYLLQNDAKLPILKIMLHATQSQDAKYLKSAVNAIGTYLNQPIQWLNSNSLAPQQADFAFWLDEGPVNRTFLNTLKKNGRLFHYGNGKTGNNWSFLQVASATDHVSFFKTIKSTRNQAEIWWKDAYSEPLLSSVKAGEQTIFTFYSRFNPAWTDLMWQEIFPSLLLPVMYAEHPDQFGMISSPNDQIPNMEPISTLDETQAAFNWDKPTTNLNQWLWFLAVLTLLTERFLTYRRRSKIVSN